MLKIGWSKKDVSTNDPVCIPGQFHCRISQGVLDPIMINCLVMDDGNDCVLFLSGDFVNGNGVIDDIRAKILETRKDIPADKLLFHITHTHCGPLIQKTHRYFDAPHEEVNIVEPDGYRDFFIASAAETVINAWDNREEGSYAYGYGYAVVGHSRRVTYLDDISLRPEFAQENTQKYKPLNINGHAKMYGNTNDDMFAGYEGGADHYVNLLYTFDKNDKLTGAIINVPCPSQNSEQEWHLTASFWDEVRHILAEKYGDIYMLPQCAAGGDTAPRILHYRAAQDRRFALKYAGMDIDPRYRNTAEKIIRTDIALRICDAFDEVLSWASKEKITDAPIMHTVKTIYLEDRQITEEEYEFVCNELAEFEKMDYINTGDIDADFRANTIRACNLGRLNNIVKRYEAQKTSTKSPMELHVIRIGDIAFASNAFELYQDFQHRIQARSPFTQTFVIQLTGQPDGYKAGYLATQRAFENRGYSASMFCNQISAEGGHTLVEETVAELKKLY